jgi:O-antigen ligase
LTASSPLARRDGVTTVLVLYVIILLGVPSELVVGPLGAAGTPAQIIAILLLAWWLLSGLLATKRTGPTNPVKWLLALFVLAVLASYVAGMTRAITYTAEVNSADRALLSLCAWCGVTLVMTDGLSTRQALESVLRVAAAGVTLIAVLGMFQFFFELDIARYLHIPGLTANQPFGASLARSQFHRIAGTTAHPIEFGVVLSATLPLVIHFARFSHTLRQRQRWWIAVGIVAAALPMSVARSAILGGAIAAVYLFYTWPRGLKIRAAVAAALGAVAMTLIVPGLLGTIRGLFLNASSDPSTQGRTEDYAPVVRYVSQRPFFGRGFGTFIPGIYRTLDNQYLGVVVEVGIVGLVALIILFIGGIVSASLIRHRAKDESTRDLAQCLKAGLAVIAVNAATFDALGFAMCAGLTFVLMGAVGALWVLTPSATPAVTRSRENQPTILFAVVGVLALVFAGYHVAKPTPQYQAYATLALVAPTRASGFSGQTNYATSILHDVIDSSPIREKLGRAGTHDYEVAQGDGSLVMGTDVTGAGGPTLHIVATGPDGATAGRGLTAVINEAGAQLKLMQVQAAVQVSEEITIQPLSEGAPFPVYGSPRRAEAGFGLLILILGAIVLRLRRRPRPLGMEPASTSEELQRLPAMAGN